MLLDLKYVIDNFENCGDYIRNEVAKHYKLVAQPEIKPTLEEYQTKLVELTK